jgi:glycosyltransferase involved in cell wall biosynthesis
MPETERRSLHVCFLVYSVAWGGMEIHTLDLARALVRRGHRITMIELGLPLFEARMPVSDSCMAREQFEIGEPRSIRVSVRRWLGLFRRLGADVGVFVNGGVFTGSLSLNLAARLALRRFVAVHQIIYPPRLPRSTRRHFFGFVPGIGLWWFRHVLAVHAPLRGPQRIIAVSAAIREQLVNEYYCPAGKIVVIHNGTDPDRFQPSLALRDRSRAAWGVPVGAVVFGSVSRLQNGHKRLDVALDLFARLCRENPDRPMRYVLVGDGPDRRSLELQAGAAGIADRVVFAGATDRPREAHCGIDFMLMTSRVEGLPLSLVEGMACGCVPIAMAVGGVAEIVTDPSLGWLVPPGDQAGFLQAMREALETRSAEREIRSRRVREHVVARFNAAELLEKACDVVEGRPADSGPEA